MYIYHFLKSEQRVFCSETALLSFIANFSISKTVFLLCGFFSFEDKTIDIHATVQITLAISITKVIHT